MAKLSQPLKIPLDQGIHNKENTQDTPIGSMKYARNAEYRGLSRGLSRRKGRTDLNATVLPEPLTGITHFEQTRPTNAVSEIIVTTDSKTFKGDTGLQTIFSEIDLDGLQKSSGKRTFTYYDNYQFISNGVDASIVWDGIKMRLTGIRHDTHITLEVEGIAGVANIIVEFGVFITYRYFDEVNNVYSDPPIDTGGKLLYATLPPGSYESITVTGFPLIPPAFTGATHLIIYVTSDEIIPSTFYPHRWIKLNPIDVVEEPTVGQVFQPTSFAISTRANTGRAFLFPERVADSSLTSGALTGTLASPPNPDSGMEFNGFAAPGTFGDWLLTIKIFLPRVWEHGGPSEKERSILGTTTSRLLIEYSTNGGASYGFTLHDDTIDNFPVRTDELTIDVGSGEGLIGLDLSLLKIRITNEFISGTVSQLVEWSILDIRVISSDATLLGTNFFNLPNETEQPVINGFNIGQFQPPPKRVFPTIYDGHLLGVSDINGLFLAYCRVDEPEHWSTDPTIALFPYLIPFKEKEIDKLVGAERSGVYLVILANDSVWRIDKLPVITAPEGQSNTVFAEARLGSRERVTDTVGCVGFRAYSRVQLSSDVDMVFFWSRRGPILTDGHRVWQAADHVDWSFLNDDLSGVVIENDTDRRRLIVSLRTKDALFNDILYSFHYDQGHILQGDFGIRFKVTGPWDGSIEDIAQIKLANQTHVIAGTSSDITGAEVGQVYMFDQGTIDSDTGLVPKFNWISNNIGLQGKQTTFFDLVFNVQEDNPRTLTYGKSSVSPQDPVDKPVIDINEQADNIEIEWDDDEVTIMCRMEKGELVRAGEGKQKVEFTTTERTINNLSLSIAGGSFVDE